MDAFLVSVGIVALGEIGDKTQLLAMVLAARYHKSCTICLGILVATLINHALAGLAGQVVAHYLSADLLRWILGISFLLMAGWLMVPDHLDEPRPLPGMGVFTTTLLMFFLAEMGDKTQVATVALAARYESLVAVVAGSTLGMMLVNVPAVFIGSRAGQRLPLRLIHGLGAALFVILGLTTLFAPNGWF